MAETAAARGFEDEPVAGFHRDVVVFDFKSLYPSLICTFGLDPMAHACAVRGAAEEDTVTAPNGARFAPAVALLPGLIRDLMRAREDATVRGDRHARQAIKIMMNSLYGVLGATISGWGIFMIFIAHFPFRERQPWAWNCFAAGLTIWFIFDTTLSALHHVLFNVAFNTVLLLLVALPLAFTRKHFSK